MLAVCALGVPVAQANVNKAVEDATVAELSRKYPDHKEGISRGVHQVARLWDQRDGEDADFSQFCIDNYISDPAIRDSFFLKVSEYLETLQGYYNEMLLGLQRNVHLDTGELLDIDKRFGAYNPMAHLTDDLYANKIAFMVALNFPQLSLTEKEALGNDRKAWAQARLGDVFSERIPAEVNQKVSDILAAADIYISDYNIYMGNLENDRGERLFPADMRLLCHWNLRDEIKANYAGGKKGHVKQRMIYEVMKRIVCQTIPREVINSDLYVWNPVTNRVSQSGKVVETQPEGNRRYQYLLDIFHTEQLVDKYCGNTYIDRNFNNDMEISVDRADSIFRRYLSAPEMKLIGRKIAKRLGRRLEAFDIWYDGFKARSEIN